MAAISSLCNGLRMAGVDVVLSQNIEESINSDLVILTNTCLDLRSVAEFLIAKKVPYAILPFHEDFIKYFQLSISFAVTANSLLTDDLINNQKITLEFWKKYPHIINFNSCKIPISNFTSSLVFANAVCSIPSSNLELATIMRDCPDARAHVVKFPTGIVENFSGLKNDAFNVFINSDESYILQVGRLETRKNQIATVLATADIPKTLVFIATKSHNKGYSELLFKLIKKFRKYRTVVVSEEYESLKDGSLEIIKMPLGEKLSFEMLESAYRNAELNLHPAFYELPGYTYLESINCGVKTILSNWTSAHEYIVAEDSSAYLSVDPYDISKIRTSVISALYGGGVDVTKAKIEKISERDYGLKVLNVLLREIKS